MKTNKIIGVLLLVLTVTTIAGMVLNSDAYWNIHNYATVILSVIGAVVLFRQK